MGRNGTQKPAKNAGRESRLKLILLVVSIIVIGGYGLTRMGFGAVLAERVSNLFESGILPVPFPVIAGAAVFLGASLMLISRKNRRRLASAIVRQPSDPLGSFVGREAFLASLNGMIEEHVKESRQLALHLIDIDRFRTVNAILGEAQGDAFLRGIGERLLLLVEDGSRLGRVGDDEFAIVQPEAGGARHAEIYARRIEDALREACADVPRHARPAASIGVAVAPEHGPDAISLLHSASLALNAAKKEGGDTIIVFDREMGMALDARLEMEKAITDGLSQGWFALHFQPQYDLLSRRLSGFEALVRMNHPERGELLPDAFLPVAEESGLMPQLGEWIIREAVTTAANWPAHLMLALNISDRQFREGDVAATILHALTGSNIEASRVGVEISEAALSGPSAGEQLQRLKGRGVTIVLDDFGLDVSSLSSLSSGACDAIKIDRTLVAQIGAEPETENLIKGLIGTAKSFDLAVLAEGVERAEQVRFLLSNSCTKVQGYLFGRPTPVADLAAIVAKDLRNAVGGDETPTEERRSSSAVA
jgi:diguanylate cyclase (GGDEF)-like protein